MCGEGLILRTARKFAIGGAGSKELVIDLKGFIHQDGCIR